MKHCVRCGMTKRNLRGYCIPCKKRKRCSDAMRAYAPHPALQQARASAYCADVVDRDWFAELKENDYAENT